MSYFKYYIWAFILSSSAIAQSYHGELEVLVFDDFAKHQSKTVYKLHEAGEEYLLKFPASLNTKGLLTGLQVIIEGQEQASLSKDKILQVQSIIKNKAFTTQALGFENRKILVLLVDFTNLKSTATVSPESVDSIMYKSERSMQQNFLINSFGQVTFVRDTNNDGKADIQTVNLNYAVASCDYNKWASDAKNAAAQLGVNLALYQHFMFVIPQNVSCDWGGLGSLGCGTSCNTWIRAYNPKQVYSQLVYTHEIGHNLGMHHSATDTNNDGKVESEYGDSACIMGTGDFLYFKQLNAPHRDQMGWFNAYSNRLKTVTADGNYALSPLDAGIDRTGLLALKIQKSANETYYISYRRDIGPFGPGAPAYLDKVSIHKVIAGDTHSYFIKAIGAGESFVDAKNNINVSVLSLSNDFALVFVKK